MTGMIIFYDISAFGMIMGLKGLIDVPQATKIKDDCCFHQKKEPLKIETLSGYNIRNYQLSQMKTNAKETLEINYSEGIGEQGSVGYISN